jgi:hypothetical protein
MVVERRVVDDRVFLLGLDYMYREAIKKHERGELLDCARRVAEVLDVGPADVPVEGYYPEDEELTAYFRLMRALQDVDQAATSSVESLGDFHRLLEVTSSVIYGRPQHWGKLLPVGRDPLSQALYDVRPWTMSALVPAASRVAIDTDDISLVGLAAAAEDPVVLTAVRESVVLYAEIVALGMPVEVPHEYDWRVDEALASRAGRFVSAFNELFGERLPPPVPGSAGRYWGAGKDPIIAGRCVRLGWDDSTSPMAYYHWAICHGSGHELVVQEFWAPGVWTTDRYRALFRRFGRECPDLQVLISEA